MKKKALSIILSVAMLTTPSALVNVSAEEIGFTDGFEAGQTDYSDEGTDSLGEERAYPDEETAVSGEGFASAGDDADEVSDSGEEMLSFASGNEVDQSEENEEDFSDRTVEIESMPNTTAYVYGTVKFINDIDLTGLSIKVKTDNSEEIISFSKNGEKKQDSAGNVYECKIRKSDNPEGTGEEIVPGRYTVSVEYGDDSVGVGLRVLPGSAAIEAVRQPSGVYTARIEKKGFVKLVPEESGKYIIVDNVKRYDEEEETDEYLSDVFDDQLFSIQSQSVFDQETGKTYYNLEKGKTYYLYPMDTGDGVYTFFVNPVSQGNSGVCGANAVWKIENGVMTISGSGATYKYRYDDKREWKNVESVVIEDGITVIGDNMFSGCSNLKSVQIADSVEKIGDCAFAMCGSLQKIFIPKNVKKIGASEFWRDYSLGSIVVDEANACYSVADGILYNKDQTDLIFVPDSKTECNISAKVTSFEGIDLKSYPYKFQSCRSILGSENSALQTITVAADNPVLASEDGVLYTKDKSVLLACPPKKKSLIVAAETKQIGWGAANGCKELVLLSLPDGLERIYMDGFSGCTSLKEVVIPENVIMDGYCFTEKDVTLLKVYANSEAERYAQTMGFKYEVIGSHTHNWEEASVANEATCKNEGRAIYRCTICGTTKFEVISKKAHEPERRGAQEATCTKAGYTGDLICKNCNEILEAGKSIPVKSHSWDAGVVTTPATCTENGIRTYTCAAGGETKTETIPATGHRYGDYKVTKEATIFNTGTESRECQVCHNQESREIPKLTAEVKLTAKTLPVQVKKSVSAKKLIASKALSDSIAALTSTNAKVAAVDNKNLKITAKKAGKAVITVIMKSGATSDITVNVKTKKIATTKISGVKKAITLKKGKKYTLKPVLSPITSTGKVTYSSANKKIATVSSKGVIKALKKGKVKITVKSGKKTVTCVVTVK